MTKKIKMHFDPDGRCKVEAEGYEGGTCIEATKPFEELFSKEVSPRVRVGECSGGDQGEKVF